MKTRSTASTPRLSVVVVIFAGGKPILRCLEALAGQQSMGNVEILVPYDDRISGMPALQEQFPTVRFLPVQGRYTYAQLRALGVRKARGAIVALTEDHCIPERFWCARILEAHGSSHAAVGGVVEKQVPDTVVNWALYLSDYGRYMSPVAEGPAEHLTDCNVSYKRSVLELIADVWRNEFHEPIVHGALRAKGESLWLSPRIVVHQQRSLRLGEALKDRYAFGRLFGAGRLTAPSSLLPAVVFRRLMHAAKCILLPPLLVGRVAQHVFRKHRHVTIFVRSLPALIVLTTVWAWGEFVGYVTGRADTSLTPQTKSATPQPQVRAII